MKKILLVLVVAVVMMSNVSAAGFMKIGDIKGESQDRDHKGWVDVMTFEQSMHIPESDGTGGRRRGSVVFDDISVVKELDSSSPKLQEAVALGRVIPKVEFELTATRADEGRVTYYKYELKNVLITSYSVSASGNEATIPTEEFTLNYEEIKVSYTNLDDRGGVRGVVQWIYNLVTGN